MKAAYTAIVRKRIVIGAIAAVVIGVWANVLLQPREGTVEWHKREYLHARKELEGRTFRRQIDGLRARLGIGPPAGPRPSLPSIGHGPEIELRKHELALIQLGFLEAKTIQVSKSLAAQVNSIVAAGDTVVSKERRHFTRVLVAPTRFVPSYVRIVAPRQDIGVWEDLIHKADEKAPSIVVYGPGPGSTGSLMLTSPEKLPGLEEMLPRKDLSERK